MKTELNAESVICNGDTLHFNTGGNGNIGLNFENFGVNYNRPIHSTGSLNLRTGKGSINVY